MERNVLTSLGLARRAGKVLLGMDEVSRAAAPLPLVLTACDASERVTRLLTNGGIVPVRLPWKKTELGHAVGCGEVAVIAVTDPGFADMIRRKMELQEEKTITIHGEVMYPGIYKYAENETVEDFVMQAGGLKDAASVMKVDVSRRIYDQYATTSSDTIARMYTFKLKDGFIIDGQPNFTLQPFDEVYIRTSPSYIKQRNVAVEGEVIYPGKYTLEKKSQRLSDIIAQTGGFTNWAYIKGARLERTITPDERLRMQSVQKMLAIQNNDNDTIDVSQLDFGETYYFAIDLEKAMNAPGSSADVVLRDGDKIFIPQHTNSVKINGNVMYPNTVTYKEGKGVKYYIKQAGGWGNRAKKSKTIIVYMNGSAEQVGHGVKIEPGCEIIVPSKQKSQKMSTAEVVALASGTASLATMIATIANIIN